MRDLPNFVQQLPPDMLEGINIYTGANIVLFKPNVYVTVTMHTKDDYHFFIPATDAPPVLLENKEILINKNRFAAVNPHTVMRLKLGRHTATREYMSLSVKESFVRRIASQMGFEGEGGVHLYQQPLLPPYPANAHAVRAGDGERPLRAGG